jgi:hypothetical protein
MNVFHVGIRLRAGESVSPPTEAEECGRVRVLACGNKSDPAFVFCLPCVALPTFDASPARSKATAFLLALAAQRSYAYSEQRG